MASSRKRLNPIILILGVSLSALVIIVIFAIFIVNSQYKLIGETCPPLDTVLPMYGNVKKCGYQKLMDDLFILGATNGKPMMESAKARAADAAIRRSQDYFSKGDLDTAMKRLNQAWLLNPDDYRIYWGYGSVLAQKKNFNEAFQMYEKTLSMKPSVFQDHSQILCDYALANLRGIKEDDKNSEQESVIKASQLLQESIIVNPDNGDCHGLLASIYLAKENYSESWKELKKAEQLGVNNASIKKVRAELLTKMPEPIY